jgi:hypothetical protein
MRIATASVSDSLNIGLDRLQAITSQQVSSIRDNTEALNQNTSSKAQDRVASAARTASSLGTGLLLSPLISGLTRLFGRGKDEAPAPLPVFERPRTLNFEGALTADARTFAPIDYSYNGTPRPMPAASQQVTIQIQALDARSILDRSEDIARAVRHSMLTSPTLRNTMEDL